MNIGLLSKKFWKLQRAQGKVPLEVVKLMTGEYDKEMAADYAKAKEEARARRHARFTERKERGQKKEQELKALAEVPDGVAVDLK